MTATDGSARASFATEPAFDDLDLERLGGAERPNGRPLVTAFANWVYRHTRGRRYSHSESINSNRRRRQLAEGSFNHIQLEKFWTWYRQRCGDGLSRATDWRIEFRDPHDGRDRVKRFQASRLTVGRRPLVGRPDVVLSDQDRRRFLIIERKFTSRRHVPQNGWPNLQAQLWAYSWMDDWVEADEVFLVGQVYQTDQDGGWRLSTSMPAWRRSDPAFNLTAHYAWLCYGGTSRDIVQLSPNASQTRG